MFSYTAAGSFGFTRGTWDVFSSVGDVDVVLSRGEGGVLHAAAAVLVVLAGHLGLGRAFHSDAQTPNTGPPVPRKHTLSDTRLRPPGTKHPHTHCQTSLSHTTTGRQTLYHNNDGSYTVWSGLRSWFTTSGD